MRNADCGTNSAIVPLFLHRSTFIDIISPKKFYRCSDCASAFRISYSVFLGSSALDVMRLSQVALQLYTLRDFCVRATDLATTLEQVRASGYDAVESVRSDFASNRDLRKLADDHGLAISAIHESGERLLNRPQTAAEELTELGTDLVVYALHARLHLYLEAEGDRQA